MNLDYVIHRQIAPVEQRWGWKDCALYAPGTRNTPFLRGEGGCGDWGAEAAGVRFRARSVERDLLLFDRRSFRLQRA